MALWLCLTETDESDPTLLRVSIRAHCVVLNFHGKLTVEPHRNQVHYGS
jgi:hypothetical protein